MRRLLLPVLAATLVVPAAGWGQAVSVDTASLLSRLERIERRLTVLEGRGFPSSGGSASGGAVADLEVRMQDLERESSTVNGGVERMGFALERLAKRLDSISKDNDLRLRDLETAPRPAAAAATPAPAATVVASTEPSGTKAPVAEGKAVAVPADIAADKLYNQAYAYLTGADYDNAGAWFTEFLKRHPQDKLADNAYYWLGEVKLVQNDPKGAAATFRDGLKAFPAGGKAPANWLKLGIALQQLNQTDFAKGAWEKLVKDFPKAPEADKAREKLIEIARPKS
jgi:tol-pal system protein YbgF